MEHATSTINNTIPSNYRDKYTSHGIKYSTVLGTNMNNSCSIDHESQVLEGRPSVHQFIHGFGRVSSALERADDHHHRIVVVWGIGPRNTTRVAVPVKRKCGRRFKQGRNLNQSESPAVNGSYRNMLQHMVVVDQNPNVSAAMAQSDPVRYTYAKNISNHYARHPHLGVLNNSRRVRAYLKRNPFNQRKITARSAYINTSGLAL